LPNINEFKNGCTENTYLSSCQKEFASNSGKTSVAFMILAARTALQIYITSKVVYINSFKINPLHQVSPSYNT
jgi:hypothetical protein